jgi:hypothetical protein
MNAMLAPLCCALPLASSGAMKLAKGNFEKIQEEKANLSEKTIEHGRKNMTGIGSH